MRRDYAERIPAFQPVLRTVLKSWREHNGLTIRAAAKIIGVTHSVLWHFENGGHGKTQRTDGGTLAKIISWLLSNEE